MLPRSIPVRLYTPLMDRTRLSVAIAAVAALLGALLARKRPVKPPEHSGTWEPK